MDRPVEIEKSSKEQMNGRLVRSEERGEQVSLLAWTG